jgi:type 1 glutamine amidotransferase
MTHVLVLTGAGRYADPWHPMTRTSPLIARALTQAGYEVSIEEHVDRALAELSRQETELPDLVVANIGRLENGTPNDGADAEQVAQGLTRMLAEVPVLALHCAANAFGAELAGEASAAAWEQAIGGRWVPGVSWHPMRGTMTATRVAVPEGGDGFPEAITAEDERYLDLVPSTERTVLYTHPDDGGAASPAIWVRETTPRRAYDALGHDEKSYEVATHRELLVALADWLTSVGASAPTVAK